MDFLKVFNLSTPLQCFCEDFTINLGAISDLLYIIPVITHFYKYRFAGKFLIVIIRPFKDFSRISVVALRNAVQLSKKAAVGAVGRRRVTDDVRVDRTGLSVNRLNRTGISTGSGVAVQVDDALDGRIFFQEGFYRLKAPRIGIIVGRIIVDGLIVYHGDSRILQRGLEYITYVPNCILLL